MNARKRQGNGCKSQWIMEVVYPAERHDQVEQQADKMTGITSEVLQCWGGQYPDGTSYLRYGYEHQHLAMRDALRCEKIRGVLSVDVYDIRQGRA